MSRLLAMSDLHVGALRNRTFLERLGHYPDDWLIVAGDVGETSEHLEWAWDLLQPRFSRLIWVPGNHELWTMPGDLLGGRERYEHMVEVCRARGVLTPEDPYPTWEGDGGTCILAPMFLLYDYTFRPPEVSRDRAIAWAAESGIQCVDEEVLLPDPYESREAWCHARVEQTRPRLARAAAEYPLVLINHFPLRYDTVILPRIPRFSIWCGTRLTEDWHTLYRARVVVTGHLHVRTTLWRDGVRFEEAALGYPRQHDERLAPDQYLREILPGPPPPARPDPPLIAW